MRNGETFRNVLKACYLASSGVDVIFISMDMDIMDRIEYVVGLLDIAPHRKDKVIFPNGREINITSIQSILNGRLLGIDRKTQIVSDIEYYDLPDNIRYRYYNALTDWHQRMIIDNQHDIV